MRANNAPGSFFLQDLAVFVAVAETEGFSAAARRLGVSKALVSTAVLRLEQRLGVRLLHRTTRRLSLTEAGAAALPHAQRSLLAAADAEEAASQLLTSPRGTLRVNAPMSFGLLHVVPALGAFARTYPEISVDLVLDDRLLDLVEGGFDLAVRIGTLQDSALIAQRVGRSRNVIVAHPEYVARAGEPATPAELAKHAALIYSLSPTGSRWTLTRGARSETVRVRGPLQATSSLALRQALLEGLGLARIPHFVVGDDLARGRLVQLLPDWELPELGIFTLTAGRDQVPRKTRAFVDFLRERIGEPPYWEVSQ
jgi:DNA-binding transcriptional LysR family regulator